MRNGSDRIRNVQTPCASVYTNELQRRRQELENHSQLFRTAWSQSHDHASVKSRPACFDRLGDARASLHVSVRTLRRVKRIQL